MATTTKEYTGNGSRGIAGQEVLTFDFPYLKTEDIKVSLNGATLATTKYTFPTATSIQFNALGGSPTTLETNTQVNNGAPKTGVKILIYRDTDVDIAKAIFAAGSSIRSRDLNNNKDQDLFFQQEVQDPANPKNKPNSLNGTGAPDQGLGKEGDVYIDKANNFIYGPKTDGAWGSGTNLAGVTSATLEALTWDTTNLNQRIDTRADARIAADATIPTISQVEDLTYDTTTLNQRIDTRADTRIASSAIAITTVQTAANEAAQLALTTQEGDIVVRSDQNKSYVRNSGTAGSMVDFTELLTPTDAVLSVDGRTGAITNDHIAAAVEGATDSNVFRDADHTKLDGIESGATADQTDAEIKAAYENNSDTNAFTDADHTKLDGIESGATADQTDSEIKTAYETNSDTNAFTDAEKTKLSGIESNATADQTDEEIQDVVGAMLTGNTETGITVTYEDADGTIDFVVASQTDENFTTADHNKLDAIESGATADQTGAEIKSLYEAESDTNAFTDSEKTKLSGIETGATEDQTGSEIKSLYEAESDTNAFTDAEKTKLSGIEASADVTDATNVDTAGAVMNSDLDGKGELLVGDGSGDPTALAAGTNGYVLKANSSTATGLEWSAATSGDVNQNAFSNVAVSGQDTVAADSTTDTLNIAAGSNVSITTNASNDTVTIASTDTNTTYSVGDGGLTQNNFTDTLKTKLDNIEANADVTDQYNVTAAIESFTNSVIVPDNIAFRFGNDSNLRIYHDATDDWSYIIETDDEAEGLRIRGQNLVLEDNAGDNYVLCKHDAEVILYYDNASKLQTTTYGIEVRGDGSSQDGAIQFNCSQNSHGVKIQSPPHSANASYTLTLPNTDGNANQVLKSDGSGNLDWVDQTTAYTNSSVDSHLNISSASSNQVLSWNGSDYAWVAQSSGGGGSMSDLVDDTTPQLGGNLDMQANNISGTGTVIAASTAVATAGFRKVHASTSAPTGSDGAVGDIWVKY